MDSWWYTDSECSLWRSLFICLQVFMNSSIMVLYFSYLVLIIVIILAWSRWIMSGYWRGWKREKWCRWRCNLCLVQLLSNLFKSDTLIDISKANMSSCSKMQEFACCVFSEEENKISADREYVIQPKLNLF